MAKNKERFWDNEHRKECVKALAKAFRLKVGEIVHLRNKIRDGNTPPCENLPAEICDSLDMIAHAVCFFFAKECSPRSEERSSYESVLDDIAWQTRHIAIWERIRVRHGISGHRHPGTISRPKREFATTARA